MTDKIVIGQGRFFFEGGLASIPSPVDRRWSATGSFEVRDPTALARMAQMIGRDPIPYIVGYDPQRLLTARPEAEAMSALAKLGQAAMSMMEQAYGMWERIYPHRVAVINAEHVTRDILREVAATTGIVGITINIDEPSGYLQSPLDYDQMIERHDLRKTKARAKPRPDYLKHDPSKRHGRGKRSRW